MCACVHVCMCVKEAVKRREASDEMSERIVEEALFHPPSLGKGNEIRHSLEVSAGLLPNQTGCQQAKGGLSMNKETHKTRGDSLV